MALTFTLTYFWKKKLEFVAAGGISPIRTDPDLVFSGSRSVLCTCQKTIVTQFDTCDYKFIIEIEIKVNDKLPVNCNLHLTSGYGCGDPTDRDASGV